MLLKYSIDAGLEVLVESKNDEERDTFVLSVDRMRHLERKHVLL